MLKTVAKGLKGVYGDNVWEKKLFILLVREEYQVGRIRGGMREAIAALVREMSKDLLNEIEATSRYKW